MKIWIGQDRAEKLDYAGQKNDYINRIKFII